MPVLKEGQEKKVEGCRLGGDFRHNQKRGLVEMEVLSGGRGWDVVGGEGAEQRVEGCAQQGVFYSEESTDGCGSSLRRGRNVDLEQIHRNKRTHFLLFSVPFTNTKRQSKKGILKKTCCALNQVESSSRRSGASSYISRGAPPREARSAVKFLILHVLSVIWCFR